MGRGLDKVRDVITYVTGLELSSMGRWFNSCVARFIEPCQSLKALLVMLHQVQRARGAARIDESKEVADVELINSVQLKRKSTMCL